MTRERAWRSARSTEPSAICSHRTGNPLATELTSATPATSCRSTARAWPPCCPPPPRGWPCSCTGCARPRTPGGWAPQRHRAYGTGSQAEHGYTSLCVRYNSGRHISHNGRGSPPLLERVTRVWPVPIDEITLIGHSMGGLSPESACHYGAGDDWVRAVRAVVMLGTPHHGAPLELAANAATAASRCCRRRARWPGRCARAASGSRTSATATWSTRTGMATIPTRLWTDTGTEIPFLGSAEHYFVCATLGRDAHHPLGRVLGDLLVLRRAPGPSVPARSCASRWTATATSAASTT